MKIRSNACVSLIMFVFIFVLLPGLASAGTNISNSPSWWSTCPRITVGPDGSVHVIWIEEYAGTSGDVFYSKFDFYAQTWSSPLNLSNSGQVYSVDNRAAGIDCDPNGNIYVSYSEYVNKKIKLRIFSNGSWGAPIDVASIIGEGDSVRVAVDTSGNIFLTWWDTAFFVCYSRACINGNWESAIAISAGSSKFPDIAVGNNVVFACWTQRNPIYQIFYTWRAKTPGASWSTPQMLSASSLKQQVPAVEIDSNDIAHIIFTPVLADGSRIVQYSYWTGNGFSSPQNISKATLLHYPALYERGNNIYSVWQVGGYEAGSSINYNNRISGTWQGENIIPSSSGSTYCDVATSPYQDKIYHVWDANGDIYINVFTGPGTYIKTDIHTVADIDADGHDEIVADLDSLGLWVWDDGSYYVINYANAEYIIKADINMDSRDEIIADFGSLGLWMWSGGNWYQLISTNPEFMIRAETDADGRDEIAVDFGPFGLWLYDDGTWRWLTSNNPDYLIRADVNGDARDEIVSDFGSRGLWIWNDGVWSLLNSNNPQSIIRAATDGDGRDEIISYFGSLGLWIWSNGAWYYLNHNNPEFMIRAETDADGRDEIAVDFGPLGLWLFDNTVWSWPNFNNPESILCADTEGTGRDRIVCDFGSLGLWIWDNGIWSWLTSNNPEYVFRADTNGDGRDEIIAYFGSLGLWMWSNGTWSEINFN